MCNLKFPCSRDVKGSSIVGISMVINLPFRRMECSRFASKKLAIFLIIHLFLWNGWHCNKSSTLCIFSPRTIFLELHYIYIHIKVHATWLCNRYQCITFVFVYVHVNRQTYWITHMVSQILVNNCSGHDSLTHWGQDKMAAIFQTTFSNEFSWMKMFKFRLRFHWSLFPRVQLTIFQHWFR